MSAPTPAARRVSSAGLAVPLLCGVAVAVSLGVYARVHDPANRPLLTLGFSGVLQMKAWLSSIVLALIVVQLVTALGIWERLPVVRPVPARVALVHRWSGSLAFALSSRWRSTASGPSGSRPVARWSSSTA